jgi:hypothetical protein
MLVGMGSSWGGNQILDGGGMPDAVSLDTLLVRLVVPDGEENWDTLMADHYLGFQKLTGPSLKHVAILGGQWVLFSLDWLALPRVSRLYAGRSNPEMARMSITGYTNG